MRIQGFTRSGAIWPTPRLVNAAHHGLSIEPAWRALRADGSTANPVDSASLPLVSGRRVIFQPMTDAWKITGGPTQVDPIPRDADSCHWLWTVQRGDETRTIRVVMSGTLAGTEPTTLPSPIDQAVAMIGRPEIQYAMERDAIPSYITITPDGIIKAD